MKKVLGFLLCMVWLVSAYQISILGNHGLFKVKNAQPHNMGMFSFHIHPEYYYENADKDTSVGGTTQLLRDNRHYPRIHTGLSYAIIDYIEVRGRADLYGKWMELVEDIYPERGDPDPSIWFEQWEIGVKFGYPAVINEKTPTIFSIGVEGFADFKPHLPREFGDPYLKDSRIYSQWIANDGTHFPPHIPHKPDFAGQGLISYRIGPFAAHVNVGHQKTGTDEYPRPNYIAAADFRVRPDYLIFGGGIEIIPTPFVNFIVETHGKYNEDPVLDGLGRSSLAARPGVIRS